MISSNNNSLPYEKLVESIGLPSEKLINILGLHSISGNYIDTEADSFKVHHSLAFDAYIERHQKETLNLLSNSTSSVAIKIDPQNEIIFDYSNNLENEKLTPKEMSDFCYYSEQRMLNDHMLRLNMAWDSKNATKEKVLKDPFLQNYINYNESTPFDENEWNLAAIENAITRDADGQPIIPNASNWSITVQEDGVNIIRDKEWPLLATYVRMLIANRYSKTPYPKPFTIYEAFNEARKLRLDAINSTDHYELYSENKLIFKKSKKDLIFYDKERFIELCTPLEKSPAWRNINLEFIEEVIEKKGYIPEANRKKLKNFLGSSIDDALEVKSHLFGNIDKVKKIFDEELIFLEPLDQWIFSKIQYICNTVFLGLVFRRNGLSHPDREFDNLMWSAAENKYKYLKDDGFYEPLACHRTPFWKLKKIFWHLSGLKEAPYLNLNPETNLEVLKLVKMCEMAMIISNCMRFKKINFERGSYELKEQIMQQNQIPSYKVFLKTLNEKKIADINHLMDPYNWDPKRRGIHTNLFLNGIISANALSARIKRPENQKLVTYRGNTASGKSFFMGDFEGILNVDTIKYFLKKWSGVNNSQVYDEGKFAIFEHLFKQVANFKVPHFTINGQNDGLDINLEHLDYILDGRLIKAELIKTSLVDPAKLRNYKVVLHDLDVPLITTFNRVLKRDPKGKDPIATIEAMTSGFKEIRQHRFKVIEYAENEDVIEEYNLYSAGKKVAAKTAAGEIEILDPDYLDCFKIPSDKEINDVLDQPIDGTYIRNAILRGDIKEDETAFLEYWQGKTVRFALETHAKRI